MAKRNFKNISTFDFDDDALTTTEPGTLINFGTLTTTGDLANGIFAGANNVSINHFGAIETSGSGAAGIFIQGDNARIDNFGSVITHGGRLGGAFSEGIFADGDRFYITNHGSVRVEGEGSAALVGLGEDGRIVNFGRVDSLSDNSIVVAAVGNGLDIINHGSVQVSGVGSGGLLGQGEDFYIANHGNIRVEGFLSTGLVGFGEDGIIVNFGRVDTFSFFSPAISVSGDRSQVINIGQITTSDSSSSAISVEGENASALNLGQISVTNSGQGMFGLENTHLTNRGMIEVIADSDGMVGSHMSNFGLITTEGFVAVGMFAGGFDTEMFAGGFDTEIVNAGRIATVGLFARGIMLGEATSDGEIVNSGVIETRGSGSAGIAIFGDAHRLTNTGRITTDGDVIQFFSAAGVTVAGDDALVENLRSGVIKSENAGSAAVELNVFELLFQPVADTSSTLDNFGLIEGAGLAVLGGASEEAVINHGRIVGDVDLGGGVDTFVFGKGGTVVGNVSLGGGNDVVIIENESGRTTISDFAAGAASGDIVDLSAFFSSVEALMAHSHQHGNDVVINLDRNDTLVLENVQLSILNAYDFYIDIV